MIHSNIYYKKGDLEPVLPLFGVYVNCDFHPNLYEDVVAAVKNESALFIGCQGVMENLNPNVICVKYDNGRWIETQFGYTTGTYRETNLCDLFWTVHYNANVCGLTPKWVIFEAEDETLSILKVPQK